MPPWNVRARRPLAACLLAWLCLGIPALGRPSAAVQRGWILCANERFSEADTVMQGAVRATPQDAGAWALLGWAQTGEKLYEEALKSLEKAISLDNTLAGAWANRGFCLFSLHRNKEACPAFDRALELDPDNSALRHFRQLAAQGQGTEPTLFDIKGSWKLKCGGTPVGSPDEKSIVANGELVFKLEGKNFTGQVSFASTGLGWELVRDIHFDGKNLSFVRENRFGIQSYAGTLQAGGFSGHYRQVTPKPSPDYYWEASR